MGCNESMQLINSTKNLNTRWVEMGMWTSDIKFQKMWTNQVLQKKPIDFHACSTTASSMKKKFSRWNLSTWCLVYLMWCSTKVRDNFRYNVGGNLEKCLIYFAWPLGKNITSITYPFRSETSLHRELLPAFSCGLFILSSPWSLVTFTLIAITMLFASATFNRCKNHSFCQTE